MFSEVQGVTWQGWKKYNPVKIRLKPSDPICVRPHLPGAEFKEIRGYLRKKAFFLRFLDFPGALRTLRKRAKKAEKRAKNADFGRFPRRPARHPLSPHLLHPHLRQPKAAQLGGPIDKAKRAKPLRTLANSSRTIRNQRPFHWQLNCRKTFQMRPGFLGTKFLRFPRLATQIYDIYNVYIYIYNIYTR